MFLLWYYLYFNFCIRLWTTVCSWVCVWVCVRRCVTCTWGYVFTPPPPSSAWITGISLKKMTSVWKHICAVRNATINVLSLYSNQLRFRLGLWFTRFCFMIYWHGSEGKRSNDGIFLWSTQSLLLVWGQTEDFSLIRPAGVFESITGLRLVSHKNIKHSIFHLESLLKIN